MQRYHRSTETSDDIITHENFYCYRETMRAFLVQRTSKEFLPVKSSYSFHALSSKIAT